MVTRKVVKLGYQIVVEAIYEVDVILVVTFEKVSVKVKLYEPNPAKVVVYQVVTVTPIGLTAGAFAGTRIPSAARVTQATTRTLITSCLLKSVPSRCCA